MPHPPFEIQNPNALGPYLIVCDHASNVIPPELRDLGLTYGDLARHIAYDIGAKAVAQILSDRFQSPAVFCGTSRLVIDCNRQLHAHDLIPSTSDNTFIPGNQNLTPGQREDRLTKYFHPYHDAIEQLIRKTETRIFLSIHSMTDALQGVYRPWPISLSSFEDRTLVDPLLKTLRSKNEFQVGDNQPYNLDPNVDYSTPYHAIRRGMKHLQVEFRQDEITTEEGQRWWADKFAEALSTTFKE